MTDKHERLRGAHQAANAFGKDSYVMIISSDLGALLDERDAFKYALEMIAGIRPCADTLMGNADIARAALAQNQGD